jgi:predicted enzyme related to lactoylglutathione lyase
MKPNPVVHFEMPYDNAQRVSEFYSKAFGWNMHTLGKEMGEYVLAGTAEMDENMVPRKPGTINGGFFRKDGTVPPYPSVVVSVDSLETAMKNVEKAGGKLIGKPQMIPGIGNFIAFTDSEGNRVGMLEPLKKN